MKRLQRKRLRKKTAEASRHKIDSDEEEEEEEEAEAEAEAEVGAKRKRADLEDAGKDEDEDEELNDFRANTTNLRKKYRSDTDAQPAKPAESDVAKEATKRIKTRQHHRGEKSQSLAAPVKPPASKPICRAGQKTPDYEWLLEISDGSGLQSTMAVSLGNLDKATLHLYNTGIMVHAQDAAPTVVSRSEFSCNVVAGKKEDGTLTDLSSESISVDAQAFLDAVQTVVKASKGQGCVKIYKLTPTDESTSLAQKLWFETVTSANQELSRVCISVSEQESKHDIPALEIEKGTTVSLPEDFSVFQQLVKKASTNQAPLVHIKLSRHPIPKSRKVEYKLVVSYEGTKFGGIGEERCITCASAALGPDALHDDQSADGVCSTAKFEEVFSNAVEVKRIRPFVEKMDAKGSLEISTNNGMPILLRYEPRRGSQVMVLMICDDGDEDEEEELVE